MGDPFKKVQAKQSLSIPAEAYNSFIDAARAVRGGQHNRGQDPALDIRHSGILKVRNESGGDRARFEVLGVDRPLFLPSVAPLTFQNHVTLVGVTPNRRDHFGKFVVLLEPLAAGAIGLAIASGVTVARIAVASESDEWADVGDLSNVLVTNSTGAAFILWKEPWLFGSPRWAVVKVGLPFPIGSGSGSGSGTGGSGTGSGGGSGSGGSGTGSGGSGSDGSGGSGSGGSGSGGSGSGVGSGTGGDGGSGSGSGTGGSGGCKKSFTGNLADIPEGTATAGGWTIGIDENGCLVKYRHDPDSCGEEE